MIGEVETEVDQLIFDWSEIQDENSTDVGPSNAGLRSFHSGGSNSSDVASPTTNPGSGPGTASAARMKKLHSRDSTSSMCGFEDETQVSGSASNSAHPTAAAVAMLKKLHSRSSTASDLGAWGEMHEEHVYTDASAGMRKFASDSSGAGSATKNPNPNHNSSMRSIITDLSEDVALLAVGNRSRSGDNDDMDPDPFGDVFLTRSGSRPASPFYELPASSESSHTIRLTSSALATASSFSSTGSHSSKSNGGFCVPRTSLRRDHSLHLGGNEPAKLVSLADGDTDLTNDNGNDNGNDPASGQLYGITDSIFSPGAGDCMDEDESDEDIASDSVFSSAGTPALASAVIRTLGDSVFFDGSDIGDSALSVAVPPSPTAGHTAPLSVGSNTSEKRGNSLFRMKNVEPGVKLAPVSRRKRRKLITIPDVSILY